MVDRRLFLIFFAVTLLVSVLYAERARNDHLQDEIDFENDNNDNEAEDVIKTIKRFLGLKKKTTTEKPSSDAISALLTTTQASRIASTSTKSSAFDGIFGRKSSTTLSTTTRYGRTRTTSGPTKDACGVVNPCKNGGTCKTLSSGRYYCFCPQDYYGKTCENKFITSGADNKDRAPKDHCVKSPCRNGGECIGLRTTYYCRCKTPYYGTNCDKRVTKREEIVDESNSSEQELSPHERDLEEDVEDLRRAINLEDDE